MEAHLEKELFFRPRGVYDLKPDRAALVDHVLAKFSAVATTFGYERIDTPIFEKTRLFERGVGEASDVVHKQMYTFLDRKGTSLTLRPEGSAGISRAYIENGMASLPKPVKFYYFGPMFRYERPQKGRSRQFLQFGVEVFGKKSPAIDIEVIEVAWRCITAIVDAPITLKVNWLGDQDERGAYIDALVKYYNSHIDELDDKAKERLLRSPLRMLEANDPISKELAKNAPKSSDFLKDSLDEYNSLKSMLLDLKKSEATFKYVYDPTLVRGLDYYTNVVFELVPDSSHGAQAAVLGGGRYDGLIAKIGGPNTPACGFALGVDRILDTFEIKLSAKTTPLVAVISVGDNGSNLALVVARMLRKKAQVGEVIQVIEGTNLKQCLKKAALGMFEYTVIVDKDKPFEIEVKNMATGTQKTLDLKTVEEATNLDALRKVG